ncbi:transthyretin-like family domain-containing protein [Ditylenchus destructor]|uniref:Transthyretin-like family domain-containing protein n=1 Tax=Ditylenchus destructor TaxID=166010 RepID=A0AAD4RBH8_9BILA|nr:transthyretin-like family domain-containing protein [Ditylenchus destructor]
MKWIFFATVLPLVSGQIVWIDYYNWSVSVSGRIMCGSQPMSGVKVQLYDSDWGINRDDLMAETYADCQGNFQINGTMSTLFESNFKPYLYIFHKCNYPSSANCIYKVTKWLGREYWNANNRTLNADLLDQEYIDHTQHCHDDVGKMCTKS